MKIPATFSEKLSLHPQLQGAAMSAIGVFDQWFRSSRTPFFPEYTDHSLQHVGDVLGSCAEFATTPSLTLLSPSDVFSMTIACLLHDCGMHLTEDGFLSLVAPGSAWRGVEGLDDTNWAELWIDYQGQARRFDQRQLMTLFGDTTPVRPLPSALVDWTERDRLLIGDFVRRHHTRLAHEIALYGIPGKDGEAININPSAPRELLDIAGLVARSHGNHLRATFDYMESRAGSVRTWNGTYPLFLMVLLRIADFMQIQPERAPHFALKVRNFRSPFSENEWRVHHSIENIDPHRDDPESVHIHATPGDIRSFTRLREWLEGLQYELDHSWATLGEVYGRVDPLNRLGLKLRRIRSNVDDLKVFEKEVDYVPRQIQFTTSNVELLNLLVAPLYGDDPLIGVRELVQNATDTVRERRIQFPDAIDDIGLEDVQAQFLVEEGKAKLFEITDRGAGMSLDILENYYLRIGASFRNSETWRSNFLDGAGKPTVERSGRFGIGALAGFLLGDVLEIQTRHRGDLDHPGYIFSARIEDDLIEIRRAAKPLAFGTTVRIALKPSTKEKLKVSRLDRCWNIFFGNDVTYKERIADGVKSRAVPANLITVPDATPKHQDRWISVNSKFDSLHWGPRTELEAPEGSYSIRDNSSPAYFVNAIGVAGCKMLGAQEPPRGFGAASGGYIQIAIHDRKGVANLDLSRSTLILDEEDARAFRTSRVCDEIAQICINASRATFRPYVGIKQKNKALIDQARSEKDGERAMATLGLAASRGGVFPNTPYLLTTICNGLVVTFSRRTLIHNDNANHPMNVLDEFELPESAAFSVSPLALSTRYEMEDVFAKARNSSYYQHDWNIQYFGATATAVQREALEKYVAYKKPKRWAPIALEAASGGIVLLSSTGADVPVATDVARRIALKLVHDKTNFGVVFVTDLSKLTRQKPKPSFGESIWFDTFEGGLCPWGLGIERTLPYIKNDEVRSIIEHRLSLE